MFFILHVYGVEHPIPSRDAIFQEFMSDLLHTTTSGYVILGHKPLDICGFDSLRSHIPGSSLHRNSVLGLFCQESLRDIQVRDGWIFSIQQSACSDGYELLIGNRPALIAAINAHLELFQLRFGFNMNPNELLDQLQQFGFEALFKGEIALQGIILGYGYENAISCERFVKRKYTKIDEFNDFTYYTPTSSSDLTMIPFTYHLHLPKNKALIRLYQQDQKKVEAILQKSNWSKHIFSTCFKETKKNKLVIENELSISQKIAWSIRESCSIYFSPQFIQGMRAAEAGQMLIEPKEFLFFSYFYRDDFTTKNGRDNRIFSNHFFQTDTTPKTTLIPGQLTIRTLQEGTDTTQTIMHPQDGLFLYSIKTLEGAPIGGSLYLQDPAPIPEKDLFPGIAYGVIGMHLGEEREIIIHPDLFNSTTFEYGKPIIVRIVCKSISKSTPNPSPLSLVPINMRNCSLSITNAEQFSTIQSKIQEWAGWQTWMHYKGSVSLEDIIDLMQAQKHLPLSSKEKLELLLFEWTLYKQEKQRSQQLQMHKLKDESPPKSLSQRNHIEETSMLSVMQK